MGKRKSKVKYSKKVSWMKPFVDSVSSMVPLERLRSISGYKVKKGLTETTYGALTKYSDERKFRMSIRMFEYKHKKHLKMRCETLLLTLAHELAHIVHWEHTPEHFKLQGEIIIEFFKILKKSEIRDYMTRHPEKHFEG